MSFSKVAKKLGKIWFHLRATSPARYHSIPCFAKENWTAAGYRLVPDKKIKFYYVYVLKSKTKKFIYIGYSENLKTRFKTHNKGENISTKPYIPLELIHYEAYRNIKDAKRRELYLKLNKGKTTLRTMLKDYFQDA